jgi:hypothetical protein
MDIGSMHEEIQANGGIFFCHAHVQSWERRHQCEGRSFQLSSVNFFKV